MKYHPNTKVEHTLKINKHLQSIHHYIKEIITMKFLLLPSARLALYQSSTKVLTVFPISAQQFLLLPTLSKLVLTHQKTLKIFEVESLKMGKQGEPVVASFNKKIEGLTLDEDSKIYVSDKFGDIYSVNLDGTAKHLNSNLGIPTFLTFLSSGNHRYLAVGDEENRIKIYNQQRMHQIKAFWFLTRRVPIQMITPIKGKTLVLLQPQQADNVTGQHSQNSIQIHEINNNLIEESEFPGKLIHRSFDIQQGKECKFQTLIHSQSGSAYLLKLFSNHITVVAFSLKEGDYLVSKEINIAIPEGDWDSLSGDVEEAEGVESLLLAYGRQEILQELSLNNQPYEKNLSNTDGKLQCSLNQNQHVIICRL